MTVFYVQFCRGERKSCDTENQKINKMQSMQNSFNKVPIPRTIETPVLIGQ